MKTKMTTTRKLLLGSILALATSFAPPQTVRAADHGDGPTTSVDRACDIGDLYFFLDPNDATKVVLIGTVQGFIVPSEASNFSVFDPNVRYRFAIENTGDAEFDKYLDVTFSPRLANEAGPLPQTATISISGLNRVLTAPTTNPTLAGTATQPTVTPLSTLGVSFFAGEVDDPFFFDIVGFNRFVTKVLAHDTTAASELSRGRDSFAGYNTLAIALRVPIVLLKAEGSTLPGLGANFQTQRHLVQTPLPQGFSEVHGGYRTIDRVAIPAVNVALIPFNLKNRYNAFSTLDDKNGFFAPSIIGTIKAVATGLGYTTAQADAAVATLASVAVTKGDILRLNTSIANTGTGGGTTPSAGFPNGRRLKDDVIDTILTIINNGNAAGDSVSANDVPFQDAFPYLALPQQPRATGVTDDNTRN